MCKKIKVNRVVPWQPYGVGMPQLDPLIMHFLVPHNIEQEFIVNEGNYFFDLLPEDMLKEEKLVKIQRQLQKLINRRYNF